MFQTGFFILFVSIVFGIYWKAPAKCRWMILLAAGYLFYAVCDLKYIFLLFGVTVFTYWIATAVEKSSPKRKRMLVLVCILADIGLLIIFKYLGFLAESIGQLLRLGGRFGLPLGISFYIFQTLAYVLDVYWGKTSAEKHFGHFAVSIAFFPVLLSGPIVKVQNLTAKIRTEQHFSAEDGNQAFTRILWGYFKKLIIADSLAVYVDRVYGELTSYTGLSLLLVIVFYAIQIYCDFSGYSDVAIGVAQLFGIRLPENFRRPYMADSIREFWKRWHISLTSWFREYVYIPLGGNRVSEGKWKRNILVVFGLSGLWHGASWTFVVWGILHGCLQLLEKGLDKKGALKLPVMVKRLIVFVLVSVAWIFFRAEKLSDVSYILRNSMNGIVSLKSYLLNGWMGLGFQKLQVIFLLLFLGKLVWTEVREEAGRNQRVSFLRLLFWCELSLLYYMKYGTDSSTFIYSQF